MKNWRRILVTGMVAGMIVFTGCSSNLPETNQGNRNGQRVVDAVNRRTDTYETGRNRNIGADRSGRTTRGLRGFNRGLRRAARNDGVNRHNTGTRGTYRHNRVGTGTNTNQRADGIHRTAPHRNAAAPSRGRVGHTFGYTPSRHHQGLEAYDLGIYDGSNPYNDSAFNAQRRTSTTVNNRVVRSLPNNNVAAPRTTPKSNITRKATGTTATRKSTVAAPKTNVTRSTATATPKTNTRSTTTATPKTNATRNTATVAPKTNVARNTTHAAPKTNVTRSTRSATPRPATARPTRSTRAARNVHPAAKNTRTGRRVANRLKHDSIARRDSRVAHPAIPNINGVRPNAASTPLQPNTTRHGARPTTRSSAQARTEKARNRYTNAGVHHMQNIHNPNSVRSIAGNTVNDSNLSYHQTKVQNRRARRTESVHARKHGNVNRSAINRGVHAQGTRSNRVSNRHHNNAYGINHTNNMTNYYGSNDAYRNIHDGTSFTRFGISEHGIDQAVVASASDEGDYAFFRRNKPENTATPASPEPAVPNSPARSNRVVPQPNPVDPAVTPVPPTGFNGYDYYDNNPAIHGNHMNDYNHNPAIHGDHMYERSISNRHGDYINRYDNNRNIHDLDDDGTHGGYDGRYGNQLKPLPKSEPGKYTPVRRAGQRAMK